VMQSISAILDRSFTDGDGTVTYVDKTWYEVRLVRNNLLALSDIWYPKDRWDQLNTTKKGEMNTFRQDLRDLTGTWESANDAWDNMPEVPSWSMLLPALPEVTQ